MAGTADRHSDLLPGELDARQLGALLGCSDRTIRELRERGVISTGTTRGRFPAAAAVRAIVSHYREVAAGRRNKAGQGFDLVTERARLAAAQADRAELELAHRRGELVDGKAIRLAYVGMVTAARNRLRAIPTKAKTIIPTLAVADVETLETLIDEALTELAEGKEADE